MLLNKCKTGDHIGLCKHCKIASIYRLYGIFFSVSWLFCFSIFRKLGPGSALGEKEKKIGERGEPTGSLGRERVAVAPPVPPLQPTHRLPLLANIYFSYFTPCFAFSPTSEPRPGLIFCWNCKLWIFSERICPARLIFLLSLELSELSTPQAEVIRLQLSRPR